MTTIRRLIPLATQRQFERLREDLAARARSRRRWRKAATSEATSTHEAGHV